jgi:hypothetical protein
MNRWGAMARDHWAQHRPTAYAEITDPEEHFSRLGDHIYDEITHLEMAQAGDDQPGEGFWGKVRRLETARLMAREQVLREILPITEEDEAEQQREAEQDRGFDPDDWDDEDGPFPSR